MSENVPSLTRKLKRTELGFYAMTFLALTSTAIGIYLALTADSLAKLTVYQSQAPVTSPADPGQYPELLATSQAQTIRALQLAVDGSIRCATGEQLEQLNSVKATLEAHP